MKNYYYSGINAIVDMPEYEMRKNERTITKTPSIQCIAMQVARQHSNKYKSSFLMNCNRFHTPHTHIRSKSQRWEEDIDNNRKGTSDGRRWTNQMHN